MSALLDYWREKYRSEVRMAERHGVEPGAVQQLFEECERLEAENAVLRTENDLFKAHIEPSAQMILSMAERFTRMEAENAALKAKILDMQQRAAACGLALTHSVACDLPDWEKRP